MNKRINIFKKNQVSKIYISTYVTQNHKTSHKRSIFLNWDFYIIWKLNK